ncbi:hypothetical protein J7E97_08050 [Streptomyces sp. ISL-66]|uniref:hypothetical protein n=1 Tax=Streptomyces sp. ISL-66 TaxID=2819186 RepID=UPI001BE8935F|nr:hypothetical protein [Streptomyces sp. ISL-66]MBT2467825.1 hypothetical protein [Streptomyces sp. ISL-66]
MPEIIAASDLRIGEDVPNGIPITCCGSPMELTITGDSDDWECGTCHLAVVVEAGRVDLIAR